MKYHSATSLLRMPGGFSKTLTYDGEQFFQIHLDERFYIEEDSELFYGSQSPNEELYIDIAKRLFNDDEKMN